MKVAKAWISLPAEELDELPALSLADDVLAVDPVLVDADDEPVLSPIDERAWATALSKPPPGGGPGGWPAPAPCGRPLAPAADAENEEPMPLDCES